MQRRSFLKSTLIAPWAALAAVTAFVQACRDGGSNSYYPGGNSMSCYGAAPTNIDLHFHPTCVQQAVLDAPMVSNDVDMGPGGSGPHTHVLTLTDADIADIKAGLTRTYTSTTSNLHSHQVTFN